MRKRFFSRKEGGDMGISSMIFSIAMVVLMYVFTLYIMSGRQLRLFKNVAEDGLVITSLSSPSIDREALRNSQINGFELDDSTGGYILKPDAELTVIMEPSETFNSFLSLVEDNVFLKYEGSQTITDICVKEIIIYNVEDNDVNEFQYVEGGAPIAVSHPDGKNSLTAPNGKVVSRSSIYSEIQFNYTNMFGRVHRGLTIKVLVNVRPV